MQTSSATQFWTGWGITIVVALMLTMSAALKISNSEELREQFVGNLGYPQDAVLPIAILELCCIVVYLIPRTTVLGAVLLTGYLGGAVATHVRIHDQFVFPVIFGMIVWLGVYLREPRLRSLLPLRQPSAPVEPKR